MENTVKTISPYVALVELTRQFFEGKEISDELKGMLDDERFLQAVYIAAERHDITPIIAAQLDNLKVLSSGKIADEFHKSQMMAMFRYERIRYDQERFFDVLEKNEIEFMPLKGAILRSYYPQPYLRTSCDIDILIHDNDLDKAMQALTNAGFKTDERVGSHDVSFFSENDVHLELHFTLYECMDIEDIWNTSVAAKGFKYKKLMSRETFYCHQVAHCAKHFSSSGCGIRLFLDMWLLLEAEQYDNDELDRILGYGKLITFEKAARKIAYVWFGGKEHTKLTEDMQNYIFKSGIYGNVEHKVTISQKKSGGAVGYAIKRIFMPYTQMCYYYPALKKHKWLLPFLEVARWFRLLFGGKAKKSLKELSTNVNVSKDKQNTVLGLLDSLDL